MKDTTFMTTHGQHSDACTKRRCICATCVKDNTLTCRSLAWQCCQLRRRKCTDETRCQDYIREPGNKEAPPC